MSFKNEKDITVSIITVCFNSENVIKETLESVLNQNFDDFEYIVKDGKSTDGTWEILKSYESKFNERDIPYIIISEEDTCLYEAMNIGIEKSRGKWLNFMNSGDCFYNNHVLSDIFTEEYEAAVLYGNNIIEDEFGVGLNIANIRMIGKKMPFNHQAAFFNSIDIKKFMYNVEIKIGADYDLVLKLYETGKKFIHIDIIVSKYRLDGVSSTKYVEVAKDRQYVRNIHGYKDNFIVEKIKIIEAYTKESLERYCPKFILQFLNYFYKVYIKKYKLSK